MIILVRQICTKIVSSAGLFFCHLDAPRSLARGARTAFHPAIPIAKWTVAFVSYVKVRQFGKPDNISADLVILADAFFYHNHPGEHLAKHSSDSVSDSGKLRIDMANVVRYLT
jgi:hypothetical protein